MEAFLAPAAGRTGEVTWVSSLRQAELEGFTSSQLGAPAIGSGFEAHGARFSLALLAAGVVALTRPFSKRRVGRKAVTTTWTPNAQDHRTFASEAEYKKSLLQEGDLPAGFRVGNGKLTFEPAEVPGKQLPMTISLIALDEPTDSYGAVFTKNAFPGCPVVVGRRRLEAGQPLQAVVVNNKVSNVMPGNDGVAASEEVCAAVAEALGLPSADRVLPSSTGVIGWGLPTKEMTEAVPKVAKELQNKNILPLAEGIMTTDRYAKVSSAVLPGGGRIVGVAKGAGMIEPNMATMLSYLLTDADLPLSRQEVQEMLVKAVDESFNCISIDGDESTSDTVALLSSGKKPCNDVAAFKKALIEVCKDLAAQVVRNGEGTGHVIRVAVSGAQSDATARRVGKAVVNGPLFKSAVAGNDPNVGRLVAKVGQALSQAGKGMTKGAVCKIGGEVIFENGVFALDGEKEQRLNKHFLAASQNYDLHYPEHQRVVDIEVKLGGGGSGSAVVLGADLTKEYVAINADYRS